MIPAPQQKIDPLQPCPCCSGQSYRDCCAAVHEDISRAQLAEQLMRARFSAYCLGLWPFLSLSGPQDEPADTEQAAMQRWCADKTWLSLQLVSTKTGKAGDSEGWVEFVAFYREQGNTDLLQHHELSRFLRRDDHWYFASGEGLGPVDIGRNQTCPCGSGKKYKRCCGG